MEKQPFEIDIAMVRIREAVQPYPKAAMFELRDDGFGSPFEQLIACMLSVRTRDEVSLVTARRLFEVARTPDAMADLTPGKIDALVPDVTFHERKAAQIRDIAIRVRDDYDNMLPCDAEIMQSFAGIGPKCANLALGIACGQQRISVDIHVHRVTNRWGYVATNTPEQTMTALQKTLPLEYWVEINERLVPFGKHVCTGTRPKCSTCPVLEMCRQVGVTGHR
ncbi:MAG: endonuclease III [Chloroflexia bacterium]|jgi:endonuclease-3|nr:endonuclease III [Chloroflexia bacterium]